MALISDREIAADNGMHDVADTYPSHLEQVLGCHFE